MKYVQCMICCLDENKLRCSRNVGEKSQTCAQWATSFWNECHFLLSVLAIGHPFGLWPKVEESLDSRIISVGAVTIVSSLNSWQNLSAVTFFPGQDPEVSFLLVLFRFGPSVSCILNGCYNLWDIACADMELGKASLFSGLWEGNTIFAMDNSLETVLCKHGTGLDKNVMDFLNCLKILNRFTLKKPHGKKLNLCFLVWE